ncbi:MAG: hypothetical protein ACRC1K_12430, partial [Planctomycetia bacterium]
MERAWMSGSTDRQMLGSLDGLLSVLRLWLPPTEDAVLYWDGAAAAPLRAAVASTLDGRAPCDLVLTAAERLSDRHLEQTAVDGALTVVARSPFVHRSIARRLQRLGWGEETCLRFQGAEWYETPGLFATSWLARGNDATVPRGHGRGKQVRRALDRVGLPTIFAAALVSVYRRRSAPPGRLVIDQLRGNIPGGAGLRPVCILHRSAPDKLVVRLETALGSDAVYLKMPLSAMGVAKVERNWEALERFQSRFAAGGAVIPRPLARLEAPEGALTVESGVVGEPYHSANGDRPLTMLRRQLGQAASPPRPMLEALPDLPSFLVDEPAAEHAFADGVRALRANPPVACSLYHGDLNP